MRNAWIVAQRELGAIFVQPIAYVFSVFIIFMAGLAFVDLITRLALQPGGGGPLGVDGALGWFMTLYLFAAPAITMRLLAEEHQSGTMELLMTLPIRDGEVIFGKFLAAFIFYLSTAALTLVYPFILISFGNPDIGPILTSYLGVVLWGSGLLSVGILASALTENQIVAFIMGLGFNLALFFTSFFSQIVGDNQLLSTILTELAFNEHRNNFMSGVILAKDVAYYVLLTAVFLFAAARVLESRRWR